MSCHREDELLDALGRGYVGEELAAHVAECASCSEIHVVAGAVLHDRGTTISSAPVPSAGTMLFRMQLRKRQEAQAVARRSLLIGQAATLFVAVAIVAALFGVDVANGMRTMFGSLHLNFSTPLMLTIAAWALAAPIAGYVAITQK